MIALTLVGLILRLAWVLELALLPWFEQHTSDSYVYDAAARRIAGGDVLLGHAPLTMSPGYFYLLGGVYWAFGSGPWPMRIVQILLGAATIPVTFFVARRLLEPVPALAAAGLVAFAGPMIFFDGLLLPESAAALAVSTLALAVLRAQERTRARDMALVGVVAGLAAVLRPNVLLVLPVAAALAASARVGRGPRAAALACALIASLAVMAPITVRNYFASGQTVALTTHGGLNLFIGNGPGANGTFRVPPEVPGADSPVTQFASFDRAAEVAVGHPLDASEADAYWRGRVLDHVVAHPLDAAALLARKTHLFFNARDLGLVLSHELARRLSPVLGGPLVQFGLVAPFAFVGLLLSLTARRGRPDWTLGWLTLGLSASVIVVFVTDRYRTPLMPLLVVLGVWLITRLHALVVLRATGPLSLLGAALGVALLVAWPVPGDRHFDRDYALLALGYAEMGDFEAAETAVDTALRIDPGSVVGLEARALTLEMLGDPRTALAWERARDAAAASGDESRRARAEERLLRHRAR